MAQNMHINIHTLQGINMRFNYSTALVLLSICTSSLANTYRGTLFKRNGAPMAKISHNNNQVEVHLQASKKHQKYLDKVLLNRPDYIFELDGELNKTNLTLSKMPSIVGGLIDIKGHLTKSDDQLYINGMKAKFGRTKVIYRDKFDEKSEQYFINKKVHIQGQMEEDTLVINAIILDDLLSASENNEYPPVSEFQENPLKYVLKEMPKNENSQKRIPFRGVLKKNSNYTAAPGDNYLFVTYSGRQGDDPGAAAGHFALGMGTVNDDLSLKGETFNFYFTGPKEVLASNTGLVSYFGHLIQGQVNYRPTYSLIAYGKSKKELLKLRDLYEDQLHRVRTEEGLTITQVYNCVTTSLKALKKVGIKGASQYFWAQLFDIQNLALPLAVIPKPRPIKDESVIRVASYAARKDPQLYVPRQAFEDLAKSLVKKSKKFGIDRVDYVFMPQTESNRPVGGIGYNDVFKEATKILKFRDKRAKRIKNEEWAKKVVANTNSSTSELSRAKDILANAISQKKDQEQIDEVLEIID